MPLGALLSLICQARIPERVLAWAETHKEPRVQEAAARNPAAPAALLERLVKNAVQHRLYILGSVARNPGAPLSLLEALAQDPERYVRQGVAQNPSTPLPLLEVLAKDQERGVRYEVARSKNIPPRSSPGSRRTARRPSANRRCNTQGCRPRSRASSSVQGAILPLRGSPPLPIPRWIPEELRRATQLGPFVRALLAANPRTPPEALEAFIEDYWEVLQSLAGNPGTPEQLFARLAEDGIWRGHTRGDKADSQAYNIRRYIRCSLGKNPRCPREILAKFAGAREKTIRIAVAQNPSTPPELLAKLSEDAEYLVRYYTAQNPSTPKEHLRLLYRASGIRTLGDILTVDKGAVKPDPSLPKEALASLAKGGGFARTLAAINPRTPKEALETLAGDALCAVRTALAMNQEAPPEILFALAGDRREVVRRAAAENPRLPLLALERLLVDDSSRVAAIAEKNPGLRLYLSSSQRDIRALVEATSLDLSLAEEDLERFSGYGYKARRLAARHPKTPPAALSRLAKDPNSAIRHQVAQAPRANPLAWRAIAELRDPIARGRLSRRPASRWSSSRSSPGIADKRVRARAAANPRTPRATLLLLRRAGFSPERQRFAPPDSRAGGGGAGPSVGGRTLRQEAPGAAP